MSNDQVRDLNTYPRAFRVVRNGDWEMDQEEIDIFKPPFFHLFRTNLDRSLSVETVPLASNTLLINVSRSHPE